MFCADSWLVADNSSNFVIIVIIIIKQKIKMQINRKSHKFTAMTQLLTNNSVHISEITMSWGGAVSWNWIMTPTQWLNSAGMPQQRSTTSVWCSTTWNYRSTTNLSSRSTTLIMHTVFLLLIFRKIITMVATRGQILKLKCTKFYLAGALPQTPLGELTALHQTP